MTYDPRRSYEPIDDACAGCLALTTILIVFFAIVFVLGAWLIGAL